MRKQCPRQMAGCDICDGYQPFTCLICSRAPQSALARLQIAQNLGGLAVERPKERRAFLRFLKRLFRPGRNKLGVLYAMHSDRGFSFY
jgi:hypothetical protein